VFTPLIKKVEQLSNIKYTEGDPSTASLSLAKGLGIKTKETDIAIRVIVDHVRAVAFTIADGQLPSNNGAGYVIRRILRRAIRYGFSFLNLSKPFINELVPVLAQEFGDAFPELKQQQDFVQKVILEEEVSFLRTLENGLSLIKNNDLKGEEAFKLYDTFGFPIDLTLLIAKERGLKVDIAGFEALLKEQKNRSRKDAEVSKDDWISIGNTTTESEFIGYDTLKAEVKITRYRKVEAKKKQFFQLILNETPFYGESGGQVGDTGYLQSANEKIDIIDTQKENNLIVHITDKLPQNINADFVAHVNIKRRILIADNHSTTHLLHAALKQVLGSHINQKGSLVAPDYLRFDFSHFTKVTDEEIKKVEHIVNQKIRENIPLNEQRSIPIAEAQAQGATALFGEKYGDTVRVITFDKEYSVELCGGTHVAATGQIGCFKITAESSVAAGVRRIEAITADKAEEYINQHIHLVEEAKTLLNNPKDLKKGIENLINEKEGLQKRLETLENAQVQQVKAELKTAFENINGVNFLSRRISINSADAIKNLAFALNKEVENIFLVLAAEVNEKPNITVIISEDLVKDKGYNAGKIIRELAQLIKGGGGGQPFYATAGGSDISGLDAVIEKAKKYV